MSVGENGEGAKRYLFIRRRKRNLLKEERKLIKGGKETY
jgi:hypothetical protein